jgi:4-hydroxybenzoate polyprenyltransferase
MTDDTRTRSQLSLYLDLIRWNRPAGWLLLLWPSLSALWLAAKGFPGWHLLTVFVLGTFLMRSAGCCINDVADRDFDKHVERTAQRPVTSGALSVKQALIAGALLALCAFALVLTTNAVTVVWSFVALAVTLVYPYAKRYVAMPQAVLGVAFSFGIPMAFAAVNGGPLTPLGVWHAVPPLAWALLLVNLFWVLAYDTEYAMVDREDDLRIGMKTSAITLGAYDVLGVMLFYAVYLFGMLYLLHDQGLGWPQWFSMELAGIQALWHFGMIYRRERAGCFRAFRMNHWLGATVFAGISLGFALQPVSA